MFQLGCASRACFQNELLSGLTVALALVPEAVAFAFVAGVDPLVGLYAVFMVGLLAAIIVVIEFQHSRVADHSAIEAIDTLAERYIKAGKTLHLRHLSDECRHLLKKAGDLVEVNVLEDPRYHIADDQIA